MRRVDLEVGRRVWLAQLEKQEAEFLTVLEDARSARPGWTSPNGACPYLQIPASSLELQSAKETAIAGQAGHSTDKGNVPAHFHASDARSSYTAVGIGLLLSDALQAREPWFWFLVPRRWSAPDERPKSPGVQGIFSTFLVDVITFANGATRPWVCLAWRISANAKRMLAGLCDSISLRRLRSTIHRHVPTVVRVLLERPRGLGARLRSAPSLPSTGCTYWRYLVCWALVDGGALDLCLPDLGIVAASSAAYSSNSQLDARIKIQDNGRMCRPTDAR
ncbi:hypothetical protein SUNI508_13568 [Seiridium unicorne]|uniref:Uncharacterized protein n=1 Tax=Seiridium unicorne TaxID=138068 RepID=A0ABR2VC35_9PEZI